MIVSSLVENGDDIKYLYHLSDIHIPKNKNHQLYRTHFERVYQALKKEPFGLIVVTGDIIDQKELNAEVIFLTQEFFYNLGKIMPVILIAGNHDAYLQSHSRLDNLTGVLCRSGRYSLTQIKDRLKTVGWLSSEHCLIDNLFYLHATGCYYYNNLCFALTSVFDYQMIARSHIVTRNSNDLVIGLFHGSLYQAYGYNNYQVEQKNFSMADFQGYDYVLLGDIHKHQFMDQYKRIGYAGSLLQQNFGETLDNHGYIKWDLVQPQATIFKPISLSLGFVSINVAHDQASDLTPILKQYNFEKIYVRLVLDSTSTLHQAKKIGQTLMANFKHLIIGQIQITKQSTRIRKLQNQLELSTINQATVNLYDYNTQVAYLTKYFKTVHNFSDLKIDQIISIHQTTHQQLLSQDASYKAESVQTWKLLRLDYQNLFYHQGQNWIDFTQKSGLIGISGSNATGKSCLNEIICYAIFGLSAKIASHNLNEQANILTRNQKSCYSLIRIQVGQTIYNIRREGQLKAKRFNRTVSLWTDQQPELIETGNVANDRIKSLFGTFDNLLLTNFKLQNPGYEILDLNHKERFNCLLKLFRIDCFSQYKNIADILFRETRAEIRQLEKQTPLKMSQLETQINEQKKLIEQLEIRLKTVSTNILENNLRALYAKLGTYEPINETDIDSLKTQLSTQMTIDQLNNTIASLNEQLIQNQTSLKLNQHETEHQLILVKSQIKALDKELNQTVGFERFERDDFQQLLQRQKQLTEKIQLNGLPSLVKQLSFNPECTNCLTNQSFLNRQVNDLDLESQLKLVNQMIEKYRLNESLTELTKLANLFKLKPKLALLENDLIIHKKIAALELNAEIVALKTQIKNKQSLINELNINLARQKLILENLEQELTTLLADLACKTNLTHKLELIEQYRKSLDFSGVPQFILNLFVPDLQNDINIFLNNLVDFEINVEVDQNGINLIKQSKYRVLQSSNFLSGYERFVVNIAIKLALAQHSVLPKPNFFSIDEGFEVADVENFQAILNFLQSINDRFDFCLIISHLSSIQTLFEPDKTVKLVDLGGYSNLKYPVDKMTDKPLKMAPPIIKKKTKKYTLVEFEL